MSLFGTSPDETAALTSSVNSKSLFGDEATPATVPTPSLFADDGADASPWSMPTPKKQARQNLVKSLLASTEVPESYVDAYDALLKSGDRVGSGLSLQGIKDVLQSSGIGPSDQTNILSLVLPEGREPANGLTRNEFNVLLALVGLAQEGEDVTLDGVDERRRRLPQPKVAYIEKIRSQSTQRPTTPPSQPSVPLPQSAARPKKPRQDSLGGDPSADPWSSPGMPPPSAAAHTMKPTSSPEEFLKPTQNGNTKASNTYTSHGGSTGSAPSSGQAPSSDTSGWTSYNGNSSANFADESGLGDGFEESGDGQSRRPNPSQRPGATISTALDGSGEMVTVTMVPEKEGMFLFQHRNYEVNSIRRGTSVVRRFSDFVWLLDCLHKRYPFRRLPLLPPKRVQFNGTHLASDANTFLEKRRRGLVRFANALVQHPVLSQEQLVVMFLTVPTELAVWRKQATISVQEEFTGKSLPPDLEDRLPSNLIDLFDQVRSGVRRSSDIYINLCALLERLAKRNEGLAADSLRLSLVLQSLTETSADTYAMDTNDVPLLNEGINATAKHLSTSQTLLEDEARAWDTGVLEDLKRQRDAFVSMRDVFDRRDRFAKDNIPQLERRIEASEAKLQQLRQKLPGAVKPGELEKVEQSIVSDKESIVQQYARGVFIKECIKDEIATFQSSVYAVGRLHQDWGQERVKYAELQASNWRALVENVESMPTGEP